MLKRIKFKDIGKVELLSIITDTCIKIIKGFFVKPFLKKSSGILFVGRNAKIINKRNIIVGSNTKFESNCEIQGLSIRGLEFGNNVTIGNATMIRPSSYYGVEVGQGLKVGNNSSIGPFGYVGCAGFIEIGDNVMIGPRVSMFAENHNFNDVNKSIKEQGVEQKGITIDDDCWIGSGVIILDGVKIGKGSIVGAGTLISKDIQPYSVVIDKREKNIKKRMGK